MKIKLLIFIAAFLGSLLSVWADSQPLSVDEAKLVFLDRLNEAKKDASKAISSNTDTSRRNFAEKWINHCDVNEMARQALASVILDRMDKNNGDTAKTEQEVMNIFDKFLVKFKKHLIEQYSSENRVRTFTGIEFKIIDQEQVDPQTVQLKVSFQPKDASDTPEFSITFDLVKRNNEVLISGFSVEGSFDPIRNEREQVKSAYDAQEQDLIKMVSAY